MYVALPYRHGTALSSYNCMAQSNRDAIHELLPIPGTLTSEKCAPSPTSFMDSLNWGAVYGPLGMTMHSIKVAVLPPAGWTSLKETCCLDSGLVWLLPNHTTDPLGSNCAAWDGNRLLVLLGYGEVVNQRQGCL